MLPRSASNGGLEWQSNRTTAPAIQTNDHAEPAFTGKETVHGQSTRRIRQPDCVAFDYRLTCNARGHRRLPHYRVAGSMITRPASKPRISERDNYGRRWSRLRIRKFCEKGRFLSPKVPVVSEQDAQRVNLFLEQPALRLKYLEVGQPKRRMKSAILLRIEVVGDADVQPPVVL